MSNPYIKNSVLRAPETIAIFDPGIPPPIVALSTRLLHLPCLSSMLYYCIYPTGRELEVVLEEKLLEENLQ